MARGRVGDDEGTTKRRGDDGIERRIGASTEVARGGDGYHARSRPRRGRRHAGGVAWARVARGGCARRFVIASGSVFGTGFGVVDARAHREVAVVDARRDGAHISLRHGVDAAFARATRRSRAGRSGSLSEGQPVRELRCAATNYIASGRSGCSD